MSTEKYTPISFNIKVIGGDDQTEVKNLTVDDAINGIKSIDIKKLNQEDVIVSINEVGNEQRLYSFLDNPKTKLLVEVKDEKILNAYLLLDFKPTQSETNLISAPDLNVEFTSILPRDNEWFGHPSTIRQITNNLLKKKTNHGK